MPTEQEIIAAQAAEIERLKNKVASLGPALLASQEDVRQDEREEPSSGSYSAQ